MEADTIAALRREIAIVRAEQAADEIQRAAEPRNLANLIAALERSNRRTARIIELHRRIKALLDAVPVLYRRRAARLDQRILILRDNVSIIKN